MALLQEMVLMLAGCLGMFVALDRAGFLISLGVGVALGGICWWACSSFSRLWNLRYRATSLHHVLCSIAALLTVLFAVLFASLKYTKVVTYASVVAWEAQITADQVWSNSTFADAYGKVKALGIEDFTGVPMPGMPNERIPTTDSRSILTAAETYAESASEDFEKRRPFLSLILKGRPAVPLQVLDASMKNFFATGGTSYDQGRAILLVVGETKAQLDAQIPRVVTVARSILVAIFLLAQAIPFGLVAIAAYKDIKVIG